MVTTWQPWKYFGTLVALWKLFGFHVCSHSFHANNGDTLIATVTMATMGILL